MDIALEITLTNGEYRIDSRLVARSLGIEHESFMRTISTYQAEIEQLGSLRFEIGVTKRAIGATHFRYAMLNENQAIFLATLSRNTRQVVDFKLQLTKAFFEARQRLQSLQPLPSVHTLSDRFRPRALENMLRVPDGYFSVMGELFKHLYNAEALLNQSLDEHAMIEISVGQRWSRYAREVLGIPDCVRRRYSHLCQDNRVEHVWAYPIRYADLFAKWLWIVYFPEQFPSYARYRARYVGLPASERASRKQLARSAVHAVYEPTDQLQLFAEPGASQ